ncbi:uncharacterized protein K452DRAFT_75484 [Aplosporella prunicola CBS 121167]|uniref:Phosphatidylinositol transfer protein SFH5 n=1 Tax=Aplosporella prunicola CBS 121167 TaxID=1176127 RepID=A0A6A6B7H7_9PEZI|nr:uncharacterized protein K452DRAFT_75484 [Aplosporella prunicola CBS 121167]KAF2139343.1 hypothetical protein K452DRAFT_75484 [Aplosporella prunicola CBS 121167]
MASHPEEHVAAPAQSAVDEVDEKTTTIAEPNGEAPTATTTAPATEPAPAPVQDAAAAAVPATNGEAAVDAKKKPEEAAATDAATDAVVDGAAPAPPEAVAAPVDSAIATETATPTEQQQQPADNATAASNGPVWPELSDDHPLAKMCKDLPELITKADGANEVYGITLDGANPTFHTKLILQKFLRANANDLPKAKEQLVNTLKWRKQMNPLDLVNQTFDKKRFGGLGYVIEVEDVPGSPNKKDVVTFNIYGAVKDNKATFGDLDAFTKWRVAIMEMGIAKLKLNEATTPIPDYGKGVDPYQGIQVHDYLSISFLRQDPHVKVATKETIKMFSNYYPETLSRKLFVNVPALMGWMFTAIKAFLSKETVRKFTVLSSGNQLASQLGDGVPEPYGGKGIKLEEFADTTRWNSEDPPVPAPASPAPAA